MARRLLFQEIRDVNQCLYHHDESSITLKVTPDFYNNITMQIERRASFSLCVKIT